MQYGDKIYYSTPLSIQISIKGCVLGQMGQIPVFWTNHITGHIGIKVTFLTGYNIFILLDWVINFFLPDLQIGHDKFLWWHATLRRMDTRIEQS